MSYIPNQQAYTSLEGVNSTTTISGPLWSGNVFTGAGEQNDFTYVGINLQTDENGSLTLEFSQNGTDWSSYPTQEFTIVAGINEVHGAWKGTRYVRPRFTGTDGTRTFFRMRTMYSYDVIALSAPINQPISADSDATIVRSVSIGQDPAGNFRNVGVKQDQSLLSTISNPVSAFGEIRSAELTATIQNSFVYGINTALIVTSSTGIGTVTTGSSLIGVNTGASSTSSATVNSIKPLKYNPGQGAVSRFTALFSPGVEGSTQFAGSFNTFNGYKFGYSGSAFGVCRTQNGTDFFTSQSSWNLDTMNGSGNTSNPSGQLLDPTKGNVYEIKFQYLGFGAIVYSVEDASTGLLDPVHIEPYANNNTLPSVFNPTLPISIEAKNTTNSTNLTVKCGSMAGFVEGKRELIGPVNSTFNTKNPDTSEHTLTIKNKSTFRSITNEVRAYIQLFSLSSRAIGQSGDPVFIEVIKNATFGTPLVYSDIGSNSVIEVSTTNSTVSGGTTILNISLSPTDSLLVPTPSEYLYEVDPGDTITIKATGTNPGFSSGLTWVEDF